METLRPREVNRPSKLIQQDKKNSDKVCVCRSSQILPFLTSWVSRSHRRTGYQRETGQGPSFPWTPALIRRPWGRYSGVRASPRPALVAASRGFIACVLGGRMRTWEQEGQVSLKKPASLKAVEGRQGEALTTCASMAGRLQSLHAAALLGLL